MSDGDRARSDRAPDPARPAATARAVVRMVKLLAAGLVLLAVTYDFLAHANNLLAVPVPAGFDLTYGTDRYELVATVYWGFVLLFLMVALLAHALDRTLAGSE